MLRNTTRYNRPNAIFDNPQDPKSQTYDPNGHNKVYVGTVDYDYRNLPSWVDLRMNEDRSDAGAISYSYTPEGQRLTKSWIDLKNSTSSGEVYMLDLEGHKAGTFEVDSTGHLRNTRIDLYAGDDLIGRIDPNISTQDSLLIFIKNHLGSIRMTLADSSHGSEGLMRANRPGYIDYTADYLPYGGFQPSSGSSGKNQPEDFTSKERDDELGLNWHYFGARYYRSWVGLWNTIDPWADKYPTVSSYVYSGNNPVGFVDPNGKGKKDIVQGAKNEEGTVYKNAKHDPVTELKTGYNNDGSIDCSGLAYVANQNDPDRQVNLPYGNSQKQKNTFVDSPNGKFISTTDLTAIKEGDYLFYSDTRDENNITHAAIAASDWNPKSKTVKIWNASQQKGKVTKMTATLNGFFKDNFVGIGRDLYKLEATVGKICVPEFVGNTVQIKTPNGPIGSIRSSRPSNITTNLKPVSLVSH